MPLLYMYHQKENALRVTNTDLGTHYHFKKLSYIETLYTSVFNKGVDQLSVAESSFCAPGQNNLTCVQMYITRNKSSELLAILKRFAAVSFLRRFVFLF